MIKTMAIPLSLAAALLAIVAVSIAAPARAQSSLAPPANVRVADGASPGMATVSWDTADDVAFYRIGWVARADFDAVTAAGQSWLNAFAFTDVDNRGQSTHAIANLAPGVEYAFIVGAVRNRFGNAAWSEWARLTTAEAQPVSCPANGGAGPASPYTPTPAPAPGATATRAPTPRPAATPTPTPAPTSAPTTGDYDADDDGLIEVANLAQLDAIRHDLDGNGVSERSAYAAAFPSPADGMGCPDARCTGYELAANLNFDTDDNGRLDEGDDWWGESYGWVPIGSSSSYPFTADFDGNGHTIANLYIDRGETDYVGLFGYAYNASIHNVGLPHANISGRNNVGSLVGNAGSISISASYATGSVSSSGYNVGGLVGYGGSISTSYATSSVSGEGYYVGGLAGRGSIITASYATGSVSGGSDYVGGLVGSGSVITASYATGSVSGGGNYVGGLVGADGSITHSYAVGRVSTSGDTSFIGGLIGASSSGTTESYWDTETTGQTRSAGGAGKTTKEMQVPTGATFIYAGWNPDWWDFGNTRQYPVLKHGGLDVAAQRQ